jgi:hypothetical protein
MASRTSVNADQWFVRRGATTVGPVSMRLLLQGIQAGKIPRDSEARRADEKRWRDLFDVVVAFASSLLEDAAEVLDPLDLTDEEKTLIVESPFAQQASARDDSVRTLPAPPPLPTTRRRPRR